MEIKDCDWINKIVRSIDFGSREFFGIADSLDAPEWLPAGAMIRAEHKENAIQPFGQQQIAKRD